MRVNAAVPYIAGAAIAGRRLLKFSADETLIQATAATDAIVAVSDSVGAAAAGDVVMAYMSGDEAEVDIGGNVSRGAEITSDANGKAVAAAPAAGATCRTAGVAVRRAWASGDVGLFSIVPSSKTTPV